MQRIDVSSIEGKLLAKEFDGYKPSFLLKLIWFFCPTKKKIRWKKYLILTDWRLLPPMYANCRCVLIEVEPELKKIKKKNHKEKE